MPDYALMNQCLYEGKAKDVEQMTKDALAAGRSVKEVLEEGLIAGMSVVGEDFKHNILYVPEVLIAARAMKAGMAVLKPLLTAGGQSSSTGRLLMGTVRGDLHDIGKNLVCMMAEGAGFQVKDIGVDQSIEKFMAAADEFKPDVIGMSALLTTTMTYMKVVVDGFRAQGRDQVKFAIGGAPISQMFADEIGADGYGADASSAVDLFLYLVGQGPAPVASAKRGVVLSPPTRAAAANARPADAKSKYQILYWQDLPSQIKVWDDFEEVKVDLPSPFPERIDATAQRLGFTKGDDYIAQLRWGEETERAGTPADVAAALQKELEAALAK
ncbi:virulence factor [Opitutus terrae]|uniref:Cobalamin B12-binding domain protein n=1 Tax=Opitutus terrae (strain DSM 11246 / JCM 15787 / PB90-1) TaxID=452637 RepID=B1ZRF9_OPITP|nr:virulence factor [Opitutus terrae]ACB77609.1 cobalamin B12-binding domain protein [Opitutus terrae PB90-1]